MPTDGNVKMRARGATGASAQADYFSTFYRVSFLHFKFREMEIKSQKSLAVVDDDAIPFKIKKAGQEHGAVVQGGDWGSGGDAIVKPLVLALSDAIENALRTKDVGSGGVDGCGKVSAPFTFGRDAA